MPMIQLIRRDGGVIELEATNITFSLQRAVSLQAFPIIAVRAGIDLSQVTVGISVDGILTDDTDATGGTGASMAIDFSVGVSQSSPHPTFRQQFASFASLLTNTYGAQFTFKSAGQNDAGLGENITIRLNDTNAATTVATKSIIEVDISGTSTTEGISDAINTALGSANVKVNGATVAFSSIFDTTQKTGQQATLSAAIQGTSVSTKERIELKNKTLGEDGNLNVSRKKSTGNWRYQFFISNFTGGTATSQMTRGDKLQDLMNIIMNSSAGGALINPNVLAGGLVDLPSSIPSIDTSRFLNIGESKVVSKYIVGIRIPYESLASSPNNQRILRQFVLPAGKTTDFPASENKEAFDPSETVNGEIVRPNPFIRTGIAIPAVLLSFEPSFEAGDSVFTYRLSMAAIEQLVGI